MTQYITLVQLDIIIKIEDFKINTEADLFQALENLKPGDVVKVTVNRVDLESPSSKSLKLVQKTLYIPLKASPTPMSASNYYYYSQ